jgi:hypothetical protein
MTQTVDMSADSDRAAEIIRNALTDKLRSEGMITSSVVALDEATDLAAESWAVIELAYASNIVLFSGFAEAGGAHQLA